MRHGEPLADEMDLQTALQRGSAAKASEEKNVAAKRIEPAGPTEPVQTKQELGKKPTDTQAKTEEIKKVTCGRNSSREGIEKRRSFLGAQE